MPGFEFLKRLRKLEESLPNSHQLVIVCSANADEETCELATLAGCDSFLEKPLEMESFDFVYKQLKDSMTSSQVGI